MALRDFGAFVSVVLLTGTFSVVGLKTGLVLMMCVTVLNCAYAIIQHEFQHEPWKSSTNTTHHYAIGFIGNENMLGNWLVPQVFLLVWLAQDCAWWFVCLPLIVFVIIRTRCRTALIALTTGTCYYLATIIGAMYALPIVACAALSGWLVLTRKKLIRYNNNTTHERLNYWRVALHQIMRRPIFGLGFNVMQYMVPYVQREINTKTKGEFLKKANYECPYPQKMHNDYLQHVLDNGVIGLAFIVVLIGYALLSAGPVLMKASLVSVMVCGLFFHPFHIRPSNVLFWFLVFGLIKHNTDTTLITLAPVMLGVLIALFVIVAVRFTLAHVAADILAQRFVQTGEPKWARKALRFGMLNSFIYTMLGAYYAKKGHALGMFDNAREAITTFDGDMRLWELWHNLGVACFMTGAIQLAHQCHQEALSLWPEYENSKKQLEVIANLTTSINQQKQKGCVVNL